MEGYIFFLLIMSIIFVMKIENKYLVFLISLTGLIFWQVKLVWLGFIFFIIAILYVISKPAKNTIKDAWNEFGDAKPKSIEKEIRGYASFSSKKLAEGITKAPGTKYQLTDPVQIQKGTKNLFEELKKLFS